MSDHSPFSSSSSGCSVCTHRGALPLLLAVCRCCLLFVGTSTTACGSHLDHVVCCWHLGLLIRAVAVVWRECCVVEWSGVDVGVI